TPGLFRFIAKRDRATKLLTYLADIIVNGNSTVARKPRPARVAAPPIPKHDPSPPPEGTRQLLDRLGPTGLAAWAAKQRGLLLTDTTFRDAHQSLLATRVRTHDMMAIANYVSHRVPNLLNLSLTCGLTLDISIP